MLNVLHGRHTLRSTGVLQPLTRDGVSAQVTVFYPGKSRQNRKNEFGTLQIGKMKLVAVLTTSPSLQHQGSRRHHRVSFGPEQWNAKTWYSGEAKLLVLKFLGLEVLRDPCTHSEICHKDLSSVRHDCQACWHVRRNSAEHSRAFSHTEMWGSRWSFVHRVLDLTKDMYMLNVLKKTEDSWAGCRQCRAVDSDAMLGQFIWFRHILTDISRHTAGFRQIIYRSHCFIAWFVCFLHFFRLLLVKLAVNRKMMTRFASIKMENGQSQPRQGRLAAARDMKWYER